jgi:hypothetical protein
MSNMTGVIQEKATVYPTGTSPVFLVGVHVAHLLSFLCCVMSCFCFLFSCFFFVLCLVHNVVSVTGLSILDCHLGFL